MADPTAGGGTGGLRDSLAIWLMACDECIGGDQPADYLEHERRFLAHGRDAEHSGDCTKESHACSRCICDMYLRNADALIAGPLADFLAHASAEQVRVEAAVRAVLDDACRMETIRLKVGELSPLEQQLASIVAGTVKGAVLAALKREQGIDDAP